MKSKINIREHSLIIGNSLIDWFNYNCKQSWMFESEIFILNLSLNKRKKLFIPIDSFWNDRVLSLMIFWIHQRLLHFCESVILICSHWVEVDVWVGIVLLIRIEKSILVGISIDVVRYSNCQNACSFIVLYLSWIHLK